MSTATPPGRVNEPTPSDHANDTTPPGRRPSLLETLMSDTLDPGYAQAARRRALEPAPPGGADAVRKRDGRRRRQDVLLSAAGALLVGLLVVVAWVQTNRSAPSDARVRSDLRNRVVTAERDNATLATSIRALQSSADALGSSALGPGETRRLRAAELAAGTTAVQGQGLRVVIGNPATTPSATPTGRRGTTALSVSLLTDTDVRAVVNELWADGAEAIGVDGVRLTPTSAIRFAGQAVLVDFRPVAAPYTITAIGPSDVLSADFTASGTAERFRTLSSAYGFTFTASQEATVRLAASTGGGPRYARPAATGTSPGPSSSTGSSAPSGPSPSTGSSAPSPSAGPTS